MSNPTDPLFTAEWHLGATNVIWGDGENIWDTYGYTGWGVTVGVFDNGVQTDHPDLDANYDAGLSLSGSGYGLDHGTAVAGVIASERNGVGTVGIAYEATIGSVPVWGRGYATEADYLNHQQAAFATAVNFDVVNQSWGQDAFAVAQHTADRDIVFNGMESAALFGREGLGTVFVSAAGNARQDGQAWTSDTHYSFSGDANVAGPAVESRYAIVVAGVGSDGQVADYSNPGANVLVSAGAAGIWTGGLPGIHTTDGTGTSGFDNGAGSDYVETVGTSFSSPQVSAIVALMLQANPELGYRDVQEILAISARHTGSAIPADGQPATLMSHELNLWSYNHADNWNGGGMHFSNDYGFGMVDARAAVLLAETWTEQKHAHNEVSTSATVTFPAGSPLIVPDNSSATIQFQLGEHVDLEQMKLDLGLHHTWAHDVQITLTAPSGTQSLLLNRIASSQDINGWSFVSNAFRGEDSAGTWTLTVRDMAGGDVGTIDAATLTGYGSAPTDDRSYYFTNEFNSSSWDDTDAGVGVDTVNAAAVTTAVSINLADGALSRVANGFAVWRGMDNAIGGDANDTITGNDRANWLHGARGSDTVSGGLGADTLEGGSGSDFVSGGEGRDLIVSSVYGYDTVDGGTGRDELQIDSTFRPVTIDLETGAATFRFLGRTTGGVTFSGIENLTGGSGSDTLRGTVGANTVTGRGGSDLIEGRDGSDILNGGYKTELESRGSDGNDTVLGGAGDDLIYASYGDDVVDGGIGTDTLSFAWTGNGITIDLATGAAVFDEGGGYSTILGGGGWVSRNTVTWTGIENLAGGSGADILTGDAGANRLEGGIGADLLSGGGSGDSLYGGLGADRHVGGDGAGVDYARYDDAAYGDLLIRMNQPALSTGAAFGDNFEGIEGIVGGVGNDTIYGNGARNYLQGGVGNDALRGGAGNDYLNGGAGGDGLYGGAGADQHVGGDGPGVDYARYDDADWGNLVIRLDRPNLNTGAAAGDTYIGIEGVVGGRGDDTILGDSARNFLYGGGGNDRLDGLGGNDVLIGQAGADDFCFTTAPGANNVDTIIGFEHGVDDIALSRAIFAGIGASLDPSEFGSAADPNNFVIYNQGTGELFYDAGGSASGPGAKLFATVSAGTVLDINDFILTA